MQREERELQQQIEFFSHVDQTWQATEIIIVFPFDSETAKRNFLSYYGPSATEKLWEIS